MRFLNEEEAKQHVAEHGGKSLPMEDSVLAEMVARFFAPPNPVPPFAWKPGTRVYKVAEESETGDAHQGGAPATVEAAIMVEGIDVMYAVRWDDTPDVTCGVLARKLTDVAP